MLPKANTRAMQIYLTEISRAIAKGAHAVVLIDRAGWHTPGKLKVPKKHPHHTAALTLTGTEPGGEHFGGIWVRTGCPTACSQATAPC